jgi:hypothetical protein
MLRRKRKCDDSSEGDPGAGLLNLFDVWIAFAVALLLAMVSFFTQAAGPPDATSKSARRDPLEVIREARAKLEHYRESRDTASGDGERLGTAYRLKSGEVIYVPDGTPSH